MFAEKLKDSDEFEIHPALDRFYQQLAHIPHCGWSKASTLKQPKDYALNKAYIEANPPTHMSWLIFDLDHVNSWIWEDKLPPPNFIVRCKETGRSHISYAIEPVCTTENAHQHPIDYAQVIWQAMAEILKADNLYTGRITKNPFSDHWRTTPIHGYEYPLGELADYLTLPGKKQNTARRELDDIDSRHWDLFHHLRFWAYPRVKDYRRTSTYENWFETLFALAKNYNHFPDTPKGPLRESSLRATAKSVARWTWTKYTGSRINRGAMNLQDTDLPLESKQRLAAHRTHQVRRQSTEGKILAAIKNLDNNHQKTSKSAVARIVKVSRQTLARHYAHLFQDDFSVNYAVHKVTAVACGECRDDKKDQSNVIRLDDIKGTVSKGERSEAEQPPSPVTFREICQYLVDIPKIDGLKPCFSYDERGRIARVLRKEKATISEVLDIGFDLALRSRDPRYDYLKLSDWIGYSLGILRRIRNNDLVVMNTHWMASVELQNLISTEFGLSPEVVNRQRDRFVEKYSKEEKTQKQWDRLFISTLANT